VHYAAMPANESVPSVAATIAIQPYGDNPVLVLPDEKHPFACSTRQVEEIARRTLLGWTIPAGGPGVVVVLPLKGHACLFHATASETVKIMRTTPAIRVGHKEYRASFRPRHEQPATGPLVGLTLQAQELVDLLDQSFEGSSARVSVGLPPVRGILLVGPRGCGKTSLLA